MTQTEWSDLGVSGLPTGTVTLLLADVEGSTRLWETQPEEMTAAIARLDATLSELVAAHGGVRPVEQGEGDSFVVAFARASDAVACALALQRAPLAPIRLRIGVNTGEIQLRDEGNYIGPTINRTARLRDLGHGGQTLMSGATESMVLDHLPEDAWLTDLGSHPLRDLPRPERVVQLCHPDIRNEFAPLRTATTVSRQNLPAQLTSFVGREAEMAEVRTILAENRLVTLTGAGGAGKTRLAVQVAGEMAGEFGDGVWYVDLAPITDPDIVPVAAARAFGLPDQPGRSSMDILVKFVGSRRMLVVLDNCEHLLDASATLVETLLGSCPEVTVLTTSREPIAIAGEVTLRVPSLPLDSEAIALFADRTRRARPEFTITDDNVAAVTEICRRLDGIPLAIELAAARVRALSLDEIVDSLHDRFRLLTGGSRTAVRRQQTLRASVDWSHALLTEPERVLFRRLAAFMGGFDLDAAQAVAGGGDVERYQVLDQLSLLVDKSLVVAEDTGHGTRYRLLETVRQYGQEKLGESGEADAVRTRHRDHYTAMAALLDRPGGAEHEQRLNQAEIEIDNLRAAFAWSREGSDTTRSAALASSLQPLWLARGRIAEGLVWLDAAIADHDVCAADAAPATYAKALADKAVLDAWVGATNSVEQADRALAIAREADDPALLARALAARGCLAATTPQKAEPYFAEAIEIARAIDDNWRLSQILGWRAYGAIMSGEPIRAQAASSEGRDIAEASGDRFQARQCRWLVANALMQRGELAESVARVRREIAECESDHDMVMRVINLFSLCHALAHLGDTGAARAAADAAIAGSADLVDYYEGTAYFALTVAALAAGDSSLASHAGATCWPMLSVQPVTASVSRVYVAQAALAEGDLIGARRWADDAVSENNGWQRACALTARARLAIAEGELGRAELDAHEALTYILTTEAFLGVADALECLAWIAAESDSPLEAVRLFGAADAIRHRTGNMRFKIYEARYQDWLASVRIALDDDDFEAAWAEGAALSTEEAIAYAQRGRGERKRPTTGWAALTPTELDVVRLLGDGLSNKDIATRLFISPRTVQTHLTHVYAKLGLSSRTQLVKEAALHD